MGCKTALSESAQLVQSWFFLLPKCHWFNVRNPEESPRLDGSLGARDLPGFICVSTALSTMPGMDQLFGEFLWM